LESHAPIKAAIEKRALRWAGDCGLFKWKLLRRKAKEVSPVSNVLRFRPRGFCRQWCSFDFLRRRPRRRSRRSGYGLREATLWGQDGHLQGHSACRCCHAAGTRPLFDVAGLRSEKSVRYERWSRNCLRSRGTALWFGTDISRVRPARGLTIHKCPSGRRTHGMRTGIPDETD